MNIGYTQAALPLSGFAPLGGIYLVSLGVAATASGLVMMVTSGTSRRIGGAILMLLVASGWGLSVSEWVRPDGKQVEVAAVQGNISLGTKWQSESREQAIEQYLDLSPEENVDLVVWPETAVSHYIHDIPESLWDELGRRKADYVFGTIETNSSAGDVRLFNSVVVMCGDDRQVYRKKHLVPFGEYLPLRPVFGWILDYLHIPMSDFSSWEEAQPSLCAGGARVSVSVCYEDAFGNEMRGALGDSNLLLNVSEDAWFGDSLAPHQRLQMARMRAIEVGRPMVRASNTGPSAIIDHQGNVISLTGQFEPGVARGRVQPMRGETPYTRIGDIPVIVLMLAVLFIIGIRYRKTLPD